MSSRSLSANREALLSSGLFDPDYYLFANRDVAEAGIDAAQHYLTSGADEGRRPQLCIDGEWYRRKTPEAAGANPLIHYLEAGRTAGLRIHKRAAVYAAITGRYDRLRAPAEPDPDLDYIAFVDDDVHVPVPWTRAPIPERFSGNRRTARYIKTHPDALLKGYDVTAWMDAAFQLRHVNVAALEMLLGDRPIACFRHPWRDCAYEEAATVHDRNLDDGVSIGETVANLKAAGYPEHYGLVESGFMIRRQNCPALQAAMKDWWRMILDGSQRDQLSLNFVLWSHGLEYATIPGFSRRNRWVYWMGHMPADWSGSADALQFLENEILELQETIERTENPSDSER